jgi:hypothetical protein
MLMNDWPLCSLPWRGPPTGGGAIPWIKHPCFKECAMRDTDRTREFELEMMRLTSGYIQKGCSRIGAVLKSEIFQITGGSAADHEARRKRELACLRMAADCVQLANDIQNPDLQPGLLELAKQLTAAAEATEWRSLDAI